MANENNGLTTSTYSLNEPSDSRSNYRGSNEFMSKLDLLNKNPKN